MNKSKQGASPILIGPFVMPLVFNILLVFFGFVTFQSELTQNEFTNKFFWPMIVCWFWWGPLFLIGSDKFNRRVWNPIKRLKLYWEKNGWVNSKSILLVIVTAVSPSIGWLLVREYFRIVENGDVIFAGAYPMAIHFLLWFWHAVMTVMFLFFAYLDTKDT